MKTSRSFEAKMDSLDDMRHYMMDALSNVPLHENRSALVLVAVVEVVTNIIRHAVGLRNHREFEIHTNYEPKDSCEKFTIKIKYFAQPFKPNPPDEELDYTDMPEGGFGNFIIHNSFDTVLFEHKNGLNEITLTVNQPLNHAN